MGNCVTFCKKKTRRHIVLILIGLDNAGKTKTANTLLGDNDEVLPTVGFKAINLIHKDTPVTIYDLGGGPQFRKIWSQYYSEVHGVIFVIDSSDYARLHECRAVLEEVLSHDMISGKPILVLANKQDKQGAMDDIDVVEMLNIEPLVNKYRCPTIVESYTANTITNNKKKQKIDPGLKKGYHWLLNYIVRRYGDINLRVQTDIHAELERRKRLSNKSRSSQTFIADSEIATQTGFENPNYEKLPGDLIVVKPNKNDSLNTTVTIESDDSKPKLSPYFSNDTTVVVENHEPKGPFKLSPIKKKSSKNINFEMRPQSSPTLEDKSEESKNSTRDSFQYKSDSSARPQVECSSSVDSDKRRVTLQHVDLKDERASSDVCGQSEWHTIPAQRPASASQLVRRQLEIVANTHKRRLSLRYIHRNKTSPERLGVFHYEPTQAQAVKGDSYDGKPAPRDVAF